MYVRALTPTQDEIMYTRDPFAGADLGEGAGGAHPPPPPPRDDLRLSNTTGILQKKNMWFIGVEVKQETSAPPPKKKSWIRPLFVVSSFVIFTFPLKELCHEIQPNYETTKFPLN